MFTQKERELIIEVCLNKDLEGMTWQDVTDYLNEMLGREYRDSKTYRNVFNDYMTVKESEAIKNELQIERYKAMDAKREFRTDLRNQARIEVLYEQMFKSIKSLPRIKLDTKIRRGGHADMIVNASDWHLGAKHKNYWGEYSVEIAKERISKYAREVIRYGKMFNLREVLVINMGDMIEGFIHVSTRVQAELNAIEQTVLAGELFTQFIAEVANGLGVPIKVGSILDNHSRIHPNKAHHIEAENLQTIIEEFVRLRILNAELQGDIESGAIEFVRNHIDENIGHYNLGGRNIVWVHGHLDNPNTVYQRLSQGLDFKIDGVIIAHRHHIQMHPYVWQVPSMKGTDEYAKNKRLFSPASQSFRVYDGDTRITFEVMF